MAESGFTHFIRYMQERNAPPKAKRVGLLRGSNNPPEYRVMQAVSDGLSEPLTSNLSSPSSLNEDYTGSVCLLHKLTRKTPSYREVLIDVDDLAFVSRFGWYIAYVGKLKESRVVRSGDFAYLHRLLMAAPDGFDVDHQFHNGLDNRRSHLRVCTSAQNNQNTRRHTNGTSKYKGVHLCRKTGRWRVQCGTRDQRVFLGSFTNEIEAARVYNEWAKKQYGSMAYLNPV
jgi:hypothetical protein